MLREAYEQRYRQYLESCEKEVTRLIKLINQLISEELPTQCFKKNRLIVSFQAELVEEGKKILLVEVNGAKYQYDIRFWTVECLEFLDRYLKVEENATEISYCKMGKTYEIIV